jgi:hypothetical protein
MATHWASGYFTNDVFESQSSITFSCFVVATYVDEDVIPNSAGIE